jgi:hypothetical protein
MPKIDGFGLVQRWIAPAVISALRAIVMQVENNAIKEPLLGILAQVERIVALLSDSNKDNAAQLKSWALEHGIDAAKHLGLLIVQIIEKSGGKVPMFVSDWLKTLDV